MVAGLLPALFAPTAVAQSFTNAPVFQFAAFYNLDLDFTFGSGITLNGNVHANGTLWMCPQGLTLFNDIVEATGVVTNHDNPNDQLNLSFYQGYLYYRGGSPLSDVAPLFFSPINANINPTNPEAILNLPPARAGAPNPNAYAPSNQVYFFNQCDLIISNSIIGTNGNSVMGTNLTVFYQDQYSTNALTLVAGDVSMVLTNGVTQAVYTNQYYSFVTNVTFYDFREGKTVQSVQIDVAGLGNWLSNSASNGGGQYNQTNLLDKGRGIDSVYVYNSIPLTGSQLPAVRVVNGQQLPSPCGLTIATPMPLYVLGNYNIQTNSGGSQSINTINTAWTWPAAFMADAITILSGNWNDTNSLVRCNSNNPSSSFGNRVVISNMTVNAACLAGIVPSTYTTHKQYSGGIENFLRLQEDWGAGAISFWYNGSIAAMFPSRYATNYFIGTTDLSGYPIHYYTVPTRKWGFDTNFVNPAKLPPLTPLIGYTNPPVIVTQPTNQFVLRGSTAILSVVTTNSSWLGYQWYFNGTNIPRAASSLLTLTNVNTNNAGAYVVIITNFDGSVTSSVAVLTVVFPPSITIQPMDQTAMMGSKATFNVTTAGTGPFTYQWQLNGTNLSDSIITTVAGCGINGFAGDGGPAKYASLNFPCGMDVDATGSLYIADDKNNRVRKVSTNGIITTVAGNGNAGGSGDWGAATNASLYNPYSVSVDAIGNLYIADWHNNRIRKVDTNGIITTVAGDGIYGYSGDGGPAIYASFYSVNTVVVDAAGNLYIADDLNCRIRKVGTNGIITTVAGNGSIGYSGDGVPAINTSLAIPTSVAVDAIGNLYIADCWNERIRKVGTNGIIKTVAGNGNYGYFGDGGMATNACLSDPNGVSVDAIGNLYIADRDNYRIHKVGTNGIITTVAGNGSAGYSGDGGSATNASLSGYCYIKVDADGNLFIDGVTNHRARLVTFVGNPTLTLHNVNETNAGNYSVVVTSAYGSVTSSVAILTVPPLPPIIGVQPANRTNVVGDTAVFTVMADGTTPLGYQWSFNGTDLADATNALLTLPNLNTNNAGSYLVAITNLYGSVTSSNAVLSVYATAAATLNVFSFSGDNGFQFQVAGVPGFNYAVQESTNLIDWASLITNTSPFYFTDTNTANFPQQFYRAIFWP